MAPKFHDVAFTVMADDPATEMDEAHAFEPHYELHVWTERDNPTGMFAEFNPSVSCAAAQPPVDPGAHGAHGEQGGRERAPIDLLPLDLDRGLWVHRDLPEGAGGRLSRS